MAISPPVRHMLPRTWMIFATALGAIGLAWGLLYPLLIFHAAGLSLTGQFEESTGYRYFYTLRNLYGDNERPWLPQGQLAGLAHMAVHLFLTALGYPPNQLFPRLDLFVFAAAALPSVLSALVFPWAVAPLRSALVRLTLAAAILVVIYDRSTWGGMPFVLPDYYGWALPTSLLATGWLLRIERTSQQASRLAVVALAVFGGACLTMKVTWAIYPLAIGLLMTLRASRIMQAITIAGIASVGALLLWLAFMWAYYLGDGAATREHFGRMVRFGAGGDRDPILVWLAESHRDWPPDFTLVAFVMPAVLALSAAFLPRKPVSLALLGGLLAALLLAAQRFYYPTLVETNTYTLMLLVVWLSIVVAPRIETLFNSPPAWYHAASESFCLVLLTAFSILARDRISYFPVRHQHGIQLSSDAARNLEAFVLETPGRTLFLIPTNIYRPTTFHSAISKGGTDIWSDQWGDSPLIQGMFPEYDFKLGASPDAREINFESYQEVVYARAPGKDAEARMQLQQLYGVGLNVFACSFTAPLGNGMEVVACGR